MSPHGSSERLDHPDSELPGYVLVTDAAPMKTGGHGSHLLSWNWVQGMGPDLKLVITHRMSPAYSSQKIAEDLPVPSFFYPDLLVLRQRRRLRLATALVELLLFWWRIPAMAAAIQASGAKRMFVFVSNEIWFLLQACWLRRRCRLPMDVYLVDDLEESARLNGWTLQARICRWLEPKLLRKAERVFAISPGYCEHLDAKYDIAAQWLPISIPQDKVEHQPYVRQEPDVRSVVFIGAANALYASGLKDCFHAIRKWNQSKKSFKLSLLVMTYGHECYVRKEVGDGPELEVLIKPSPDEFQRRMRTSWTAFLPYSADNAVRVMVSTSFPTKLTESITAGRPVVVYGPKYASVPRYFSENQLPLLANTPEELQHLLERIAQVDSPKLIAEYNQLIRSLHSPERLKSLLA